MGVFSLKRAVLLVLAACLLVASGAAQDLYELLGVKASITAPQLKKVYVFWSSSVSPEELTPRMAVLFSSATVSCRCSTTRTSRLATTRPRRP
jgi:hypothetical protein